jgi:hypothetical protein
VQEPAGAAIEVKDRLADVSGVGAARGSSQPVAATRPQPVGCF